MKVNERCKWAVSKAILPSHSVLCCPIASVSVDLLRSVAVAMVMRVPKAYL